MPCCQRRKVGSLSLANSAGRWVLSPWLPAQEYGLFIPVYQRRNVDSLSLATSSGRWALYPRLPVQEGGLLIVIVIVIVLFQLLSVFSFSPSVAFVYGPSLCKIQVVRQEIAVLQNRGRC